MYHLGMTYRVEGALTEEQELALSNVAHRLDAGDPSDVSHWATRNLARFIPVADAVNLGEMRPVGRAYELDLWDFAPTDADDETANDVMYALSEELELIEGVYAAFIPSGEWAGDDWRRPVVVLDMTPQGNADDVHQRLLDAAAELYDAR